MLTLRPGTDDDWPAVEALLTDSALPLAGARAGIAEFTLAFEEATLVAAAGLELYGDCALLRSVAVAPGHRGRGLGDRIVRAAIDRALTQGVKNLYLLTMTAKAYFSTRDFIVVDRGDAPRELQASVEFRDACPASATCMAMALSPQ